MVTTITLLIAGFVLLIIGGELLVRGAVRIATQMGLSPLLVGLTVVGLGTSSPELAASLQASLAGSPGLALGNITGSNMANLLLILGCAALFSPIHVPRGVLWRDGGVGTVAVLLLILAGYSVGLTRFSGFALLTCLSLYLAYAYRQERKGKSHSAAYGKAAAATELDPALTPRPAPHDPKKHLLLGAILLTLAGLGVIVAGGKFLVDAAIDIAAHFGVSDETIGLTVVAIGTSMPELVTSIIAAMRKEGEIALGNVLGSNIYNVLFIAGITGVIAPTAIPSAILGFDLWLVLGASIVVMGFAFTGGRLNRAEGALLLIGYLTYLLFTIGAFPTA